MRWRIDTLCSSPRSRLCYDTASTYIQALRCPLEELKVREERRRRKAAIAAAATPVGLGGTAFSGSGASTSFGASLYAMSNAGVASGSGTRSNRASGRSSAAAEILGVGSSAESRRNEKEDESEMAVVDQVENIACFEYLHFITTGRACACHGCRGKGVMC